MPDYNKGKIYTIRCRTDETLIYVGSTIQPLSVRIGGHKCKNKNEKYNKTIMYKTIDNNWNDWYIELYEEYPCDNREQLNKREGEVIREIGTLNTEIAGRTNKEYYEDNKDRINENIICECGGISTKHNLSRHIKTQRHLNAINTS